MPAGPYEWMVDAAAEAVAQGAERRVVRVFHCLFRVVGAVFPARD